MIGETPFLGRYFAPDEAVAGKDHVVILTNQLWRDHFGSDPHIIGREIHMNGEIYTIIGVRPAGGRSRRRQTLCAAGFQARADQPRFPLAGDFRPHETGSHAGASNADMDSVTQHIATVYPKSNKGWSAYVEPLKNDFLDRDVRSSRSGCCSARLASCF